MQFISGEHGNKNLTPWGGPYTGNSVNTDLRKIQTPENMDKITFSQTCLFPCIRSFLKAHVSLKVYTTA